CRASPSHHLGPRVRAGFRSGKRDPVLFDGSPQAVSVAKNLHLGDRRERDNGDPTIAAVRPVVLFVEDDHRAIAARAADVYPLVALAVRDTDDGPQVEFVDVDHSKPPPAYRPTMAIST